MKLRPNEVAAVEAGELELRRPVRTRHGKPLKCGIKRGAILEAENVCAHVISEPWKEGNEWVFRVEVNGTWAVKADMTDELGIAELEDILPGVLSWDELPDVQVGDRIVFAWSKIRDPNPGGEAINIDIPQLYIEVTSLGRNKQGKHVAHYKKCGFQKDEYLAFKSGTTTNKAKCLDADASVVNLRTDRIDLERAETIREVRRLQMLRSGHQREILRASGSHLVRLTLSLADVEKKLRKVEDPELMEAA